MHHHNDRKIHTVAFQHIEKRTSKKGDTFILSTENGTFAVFKICLNYDGKVHGGMRKTLRYVGNSYRMTEYEARELFLKRTK